MNLPNAVTVARIAVTPLIAWLPLAPSSTLRLTAFTLFVLAAVTDYVDGRLARSRKQETDLGRLLDPLADKLLLVATIIPMYILMRPTAHTTEPWPTKALENVLPFRTPFGDVPLAWWIVATWLTEPPCEVPSNMTPTPVTELLPSMTPFSMWTFREL